MKEPLGSDASVSNTQSRNWWKKLRQSTLASVLFNLVAAVVVVALVQTFFVKMYVVPSGSMQETLAVGDRVLVNRTAYAGGVPPRGDVVVFSAGETWAEPVVRHDGPAKDLLKSFGDLTGFGPTHEKFLVKRVIGIPGDVVECCTSEGGLTVNGALQHEPYVSADLPFEAEKLNCQSVPRSSRCFDAVTVPPRMLLVLGDNRGNSKDSVYECRGSGAGTECLKFVPLETVVGHTFAKALPLSRSGVVR